MPGITADMVRSRSLRALTGDDELAKISHARKRDSQTIVGLRRMIVERDDQIHSLSDELETLGETIARQRKAFEATAGTVESPPWQRYAYTCDKPWRGHRAGQWSPIVGNREVRQCIYCQKDMDRRYAG